MRKGTQPHLWIRCYLSEPALDVGQLGVLEELIREKANGWASELRVSRDDPDPNAAAVKGSIGQAITEHVPTRFGIASVVISGAYPGLLFFVDGCRSTVPAELNMLSVEIVGRNEVEGLDSGEWARGLFEALAARLPVRYGSVRTREEFWSKNMQQTKEGVEAVGVKLSKGLPALYWINFLGPAYLELMGRERVLSAPAYELRALGNGVLVRLSDRPEDWRAPDYAEKARLLQEHLGRQYFFDGDNPERAKTAPVFRRGC